MISDEAMYWYNTTKSSVMDYVGRSRKTYDNDMCVVVVHYTNQKGYTNGDLYFFVSVEKYERLRNAQSIFSEYYYEWSVYGQPETRYTGQERQVDDKPNDKDEVENNVSNDDYDESWDDNSSIPTPKPQKKTFNPNNESLLRVDINDDMIDHQTLIEARMRMSEGSFDEWMEEEDYDTTQAAAIKEWVNRIEGSLELVEWSNELRVALKTEQLTLNKGFKLLLRDIEGLFGISFKQEAFYGLMSQIVPQQLNPTTWIRYKYKFEQIYTALDKEGLEGAAKIGKRMAMSKNPLIRSRKEFRGARTAYREVKQITTPKNWLEGEEAVNAIKKFHNKAVREATQGFKKRNSMKLEQRMIKKSGKKVLQVRWVQDAKVGRKIITTTKKALRIGKWFL